MVQWLHDRPTQTPVVSVQPEGDAGVDDGGLGWLAYERNEVRKRAAAIEAIEAIGGNVEFDEEIPFRPRWLRPLLGDTSAGEVVEIWFYGGEVTNADLVHLKGLTKLEWLVLDNTQVTDAGLVNLQGLTKLELLYLSGTRVTDAGLVHLQGLTMLESLFLGNTPVTDEGVRELQQALPNVTIRC